MLENGIAFFEPASCASPVILPLEPEFWAEATNEQMRNTSVMTFFNVICFGWLKTRIMVLNLRNRLCTIRCQINWKDCGCYVLCIKDVTNQSKMNDNLRIKGEVVCFNWGRGWGFEFIFNCLGLQYFLRKLRRWFVMSYILDDGNHTIWPDLRGCFPHAKEWFKNDLAFG